MGLSTMIRLIATDLDGTLLDDEKRLSPDFWEVEQQLVDKGILFTVASGRQFHNIAKLFERIADRTVFIAENGGYACHAGTEIFRVALNRQHVHDFIRTGRKIDGAGLILSGSKSAYIESREARFVEEVIRHHDALEIVDDLLLVEDDVLKFTLADFGDIAANTFPHYQPYTTDFNVVISGRYWMDITDKTANKGTALRHVQAHFGISREETLVFGDYLNDLQMMQEARLSYAMRNAHADILAAASHVTESDNNGFGVTETIKRLVLASS